jgi:3-oxoacyl-ACP reductase-like protein
MKDWMTEQKENGYYCCKKRKDVTQEEDLLAMGQIMVQAVTLKKGVKNFSEKEMTHLLEGLVDRYSKGFIFGLAVLLKRNRERF